MLHVIYIDRATGIPMAEGELSAVSTLAGFETYCGQFGWDIEIVGYEPA